MRRFLTIGLDSKGAVTVLTGPDAPYTEHRDGFRKLATEKKKGAAQFAEVQVIDLSRGIVKRQRNERVKRKGGDADGKRTVSRTVDHKVSKPARKKAEAPRRTAPRRKASPAKKTAPKPAEKPAEKPASTSPAEAKPAADPSDQGIFPEA